MRVAGLAEALKELGHGVVDVGNLQPIEHSGSEHPNKAVLAMDEVAGWTGAGARLAYEASEDRMPIFLGGWYRFRNGQMCGAA